MNNNLRSQNKQPGFTLIELMIVVAIISVLAAVSYPSYKEYVLRSKRTEAKVALTDAAARLERFYTDKNKYAAADNTFPAAAKITTSTENDYYTLTIATSGTYQTYTLTAAPKSPFTDPDCKNLTLTQTGKRGISSTTGNVGDCWGR